MHGAVQSSRRALSKLVRDQSALRTFLSTLALVVSVRAIPILLARTRDERRRKNKVVDGTAVRIALFPVLLPRVYRYLHSRFNDSGLAELLSSSLVVLLPPSWRVHAALYAASSVLYHAVTRSRLGRYLPPVWTLNVIGNSYLLWAFLFKSETFPSAYERVILSNSTHFVPSRMPRAELEEILCSATFAKTTPRSIDPQKQHTYDLCTMLHPGEPSCMRNYLCACLTESLRTSRWFAAVGALPILLSSHQRRMITKNPSVVLRKWLSSTLRGTVFISASITTAWAMTCLLQRILPRDYIRRTRWIINASIASLWILILPEKRRVEISLYVARLAALCAWRAWRIHGGASIPFGDVLLLGLSWIQLVALQRKGEKISGLVGLAMTQLRRRS